jgi:pimeloyl-ACP methyl ester carboxylesterase
MEYPTYGVYTNRELSEKAITEDVLDMYDYLIEEMKLSPDQIIVFGRSMGSGVACALARQRKIRGLILFSAYKSVEQAAKAIVGGFFGALVKERFSNIKAIESITCPTYFIHGKKDNVIPYGHSVDLFNTSKAEYKRIITPELMTHNDFRIEEDLVHPVIDFFQDNQFNITNQS